MHLPHGPRAPRNRRKELPGWRIPSLAEDPDRPFLLLLANLELMESAGRKKGHEDDLVSEDSVTPPFPGTPVLQAHGPDFVPCKPLVQGTVLGMGRARNAHLAASPVPFCCINGFTPTSLRPQCHSAASTASPPPRCVPSAILLHQRLHPHLAASPVPFCCINGFTPTSLRPRCHSAASTASPPPRCVPSAILLHQRLHLVPVHLHKPLRPKALSYKDLP
ncbi:hypothetical protein P7K49_003153 [Saguinus oedipus]|uniref:Uncharacterized protein n=1 Tax=Saguinus oedipus TaxID=9490 RepID=A0ABQ9WJD2_SAGOE|nr:hypothetical protein P7K49_003153 [Saguinus oedipus]